MPAAQVGFVLNPHPYLIFAKSVPNRAVLKMGDTLGLAIGHHPRLSSF